MLTARYTIIRHDTGKIECVADFPVTSVRGMKQDSDTFQLGDHPVLQKPDWTDNDLKAALAAVAGVDPSLVAIATPSVAEAAAGIGVAVDG